MPENVRKTGVREVFADKHGGASTRFGMSMAMDADDEEVDAVASSVGALHMNPFRSNGGAGLARAPGLARAKPLAHSKSTKMRCTVQDCKQQSRLGGCRTRSELRPKGQ